MKNKLPDILGIFISIACALHCLALPVFVAFLGWNDGGSHLYFDIIMLCGASLTIAYTLRNKVNKHNIKFFATMLGVGICCYALSFCLTSTLSHLLFALGSLCWLTIHLQNLRSIKFA